MTMNSGRLMTADSCRHEPVPGSVKYVNLSTALKNNTRSGKSSSVYGNLMADETVGLLEKRAGSEVGAVPQLNRPVTSQAIFAKSDLYPTNIVISKEYMDN